jgi:cation diffusion facilitator family transporter
MARSSRSPSLGSVSQMAASHDDNRVEGHGRSRGHAEQPSLNGRLRHLVAPHSHDSADKVDNALEASDEGVRAVAISLAALGATAIAQAAVVAVTGSVALLGDTLHNVADALTAVPLGIAFVIGRRAATRRYTYGYGRAEDLAGIAVVLTIAASAAVAGYESIRRLLDPQDVEFLAVVAAAGFIGFAGNELVARYRIGVGRRIGSAALVADGLHARTDGFTSLAVVLGAAGVAAGFERADPIVGLAITVAILLVLRGATREVLRRLMDAVDPKLVDRAEHVLSHVVGVQEVGAVRLRWIGHGLHGEANIVVDQDLTVAEGHAIAERARHALVHDVPRLADATIHIDPCAHDGSDPHESVAHHYR